MSTQFQRIALKGLAAGAVMCLALGAAQAQDDRRASTRALAAKDVCTVNTAKAKAATGEVSTTSIEFVNVNNMKIPFTQRGSGEGCVIVSFSAEAEAVDETLYLQVLIDGEPCPLSGTYFTRGPGLADRAMNFLCPGISPGKHTAQVQFLSGGGDEVLLVYRTMIVWFRN